jgi:hypothetical protein
MDEQPKFTRNNEHLDPSKVKVNKKPRGGNQKQILMAIQQVHSALDDPNTPKEKIPGLMRLLKSLVNQLED